MKIFWIFRTNLTNLESYHKYKNLKDFKKNLWDFYLFQGLWLLENTSYQEVTVWRLTKKSSYSIKFKFNGKEFIQRFVKNFDECFKQKRPDITFFRGGFPEYCKITKKNPDFFGIKLYLGASRRKYPIYGGLYDRILVESEKDMKVDCYPFYKIGVPNIFQPLNLQKKWDICWPCNFSQIRYKGHKYFIEQISKSNILRNSKVVHIGNNPEIGEKLCNKYKINNIKFMGYLDRFNINIILNQSRFGLVTSNDIDGCPRISTEILASGTPLLIREKTRLLDYYKRLGCVEVFSDNELEKVYKKAKKNYNYMKKKNIEALKCELNFDNIMLTNIKLWNC